MQVPREICHRWVTAFKSSHQAPVIPLGDSRSGRYHAEYFVPLQKACFASLFNTAATWQHRLLGKKFMCWCMYPVVVSDTCGVAAYAR